VLRLFDDVVVLPVIVDDAHDYCCCLVVRGATTEKLPEGVRVLVLPAVPNWALPNLGRLLDLFWP
jgi:hypothetical protein